jgi:small subunit ribosomal protein S1
MMTGRFVRLRQLPADMFGGVMDDIQMDKVMERMPDFPDLKPGQVVKSKVVAISGDKVLVDLGLKREGFLSITEFQNVPPKVGSEIDIYINHINSRDGSPSISHSRAKDLIAINSIGDNFQEGKIINGVIGRKIKGGYEVDIGMAAFMPGSQISKEFSNAPAGTRIEVKIIEFDKRSKNVVVSNKVVEKEKAVVKRQELFASLKEGDVVNGKVVSITGFGVFVDLGGVDGLLHINDVSYKKLDKLDGMFKAGDEIKAKVLKIDQAEGKIGLGLKQLQKNPWDSVEKKYKRGTKISGKVTSITPFGVFVLIEDGVEGLLHVSDISWTERIAHPKDVFKPGQDIEAVVLEANREKQKISLSFKALFDNPYDKYVPGRVVSGSVIKLMDFGCIVELEPNIHGFVHVSEIAKSRIEKPSDVLSLGDAVSGKVVKMDKAKRRIEVSIKQQERENEEQDIRSFLNSQQKGLKLADLLEDN